MGKKRLRKAYISKGKNSNVAKATLNLVRATASEVDKYLHKVRAWRAGKNPWVAVENRTRGTNTPFIKMRANSVWGDPKGRRIEHKETEE